MDRGDSLGGYRSHKRVRKTKQLNNNNKRPPSRVLNLELLAMKPIDILRKSFPGTPQRPVWIFCALIG